MKFRDFLYLETFNSLKDEEGNPLIVYHGTNSDFDTFNLSKNGLGSGLSTGAIWFSDAIGTAKDFGEVIKKSLISMENPKILDLHGGSMSREKLVNLVLSVRQSGYDGIILKNFRDGAYTATSYAVFNPEQIKILN